MCTPKKPRIAPTPPPEAAPAGLVTPDQMLGVNASATELSGRGGRNSLRIDRTDGGDTLTRPGQTPQAIIPDQVSDPNAEAAKAKYNAEVAAAKSADVAKQKQKKNMDKASAVTSSGLLQQTRAHIDFIKNPSKHLKKLRKRLPF